nr:hypothetical protein [Tanacetum cinerariifolium]
MAFFKVTLFIHPQDFSNTWLMVFNCRLKKYQEKDKIGSKPEKREAWRNREKSEAVTVDREGKTEQNAKRMAENASTVKSYSKFKEGKKKKDLKCNIVKVTMEDQFCQRKKLVPPRTILAIVIYNMEDHYGASQKVSKDCACSIGTVEDKILVPKPPKNCARCTRYGYLVDGPHCQGCALLRQELEENLVTYSPDFQNTSEPSNASTNVVNAPQEP